MKYTLQKRERKKGRKEEKKKTLELALITTHRKHRKIHKHFLSPYPATLNNT